jgi:hypothetical protein
MRSRCRAGSRIESLEGGGQHGVGVGLQRGPDNRSALGLGRKRRETSGRTIPQEATVKTGLPETLKRIPTAQAHLSMPQHVPNLGTTPGLTVSLLLMQIHRGWRILRGPVANQSAQGMGGIRRCAFMARPTLLGLNLRCCPCSRSTPA